MLNAQDATSGSKSLVFPTGGTKKEQEIARVVYYDAYAEIVDSFIAFLTFNIGYDLPNGVQDIILNEAWENSDGFNEIETQYRKSADYARLIRSIK